MVCHGRRSSPPLSFLAMRPVTPSAIVAIDRKRPEDTVTVTTLGDFATPAALARAYPELFTLAQLRWALRFREYNGLGAHVTRMGRRLYIHIPGFTEWFRSQGKP